MHKEAVTEARRHSNSNRDGRTEARRQERGEGKKGGNSDSYRDPHILTSRTKVRLWGNGGASSAGGQGKKDAREERASESGRGEEGKEGRRQ